MANLSIKIDLMKLQDAAVINLKGKTATKRCLVIPVDDAHLFVGQKGCYLNLTALEMQTSQFGDSHCVKQNLDRAIYETMTDEQRKAMPILGSVKPLTPKQPSIDASSVVVGATEDLPF